MTLRISPLSGAACAYTPPQRGAGKRGAQMSQRRAVDFGTLDERSWTMAGDDPLDRIAVRDYVVETEIGAFQSERGVTQRVQFNVVVEVARHAAAATDDVDQVLSYDTITQAIDAQLRTERINLLETLAERIAERVLANPKAVRIFIRIEKLDRIPGTLGVEIVRTRRAAENVVPRLVGPPQAIDDVPHPLVVFMSNEIIASPRLPAWLDALEARAEPVVITLPHREGFIQPAQAGPVARRIALLDVEQNAWLLAERDPRCVVVNSRTELDWAMRRGQISVWAPSKIVLDSFDKPKSVEPFALARWFAGQFTASGIVVLEASGTPAEGDIRHISDPIELRNFQP